MITVAPLPWSMRACPKHAGRTDLPCYRVRDAKGDVVSSYHILDRLDVVERVALSAQHEASLGRQELAVNRAMLAELVATLPRCVQCSSTATYAYVRGEDPERWCDSHVMLHESGGRGPAIKELPYASVVRRCLRLLASFSPNVDHSAVTGADTSPPWVLFTDQDRAVAILPAGRPGEVAKVEHLTIEEAQGIVDLANSVHRRLRCSGSAHQQREYDAVMTKLIDTMRARAR